MLCLEREHVVRTSYCVLKTREPPNIVTLCALYAISVRACKGTQKPPGALSPRIVSIERESSIIAYSVRLRDSVQPSMDR